MNDSSSISVVPMFTQCFRPWLTSTWLHFVGVGQAGLNITHHPDHDPLGPSVVIYDPPVMNVSTAAYKVCRHIAFERSKVLSCYRKS